MQSGDYVALIDGYNVIKQHPVWSQLPLHEARQQLVVVVQRTRWPVPVARVEVVFDSANQHPSRTQHVAHIQVSFASPSADDAIQHVIRTSDRPQRLVVVSNDRAIVDTAKSHGAIQHSVAWLIARSAPKSPVTPEPPQAPKGLTNSDIRQINAEQSSRLGIRL